MSPPRKYDRDTAIAVTHFCLVTLFCLTSIALAQNSALPADDVEKRVNSLLNSMTIEEKIALLGGSDGMYTSPLPRLGIPALRMSDGRPRPIRLELLSPPHGTPTWRGAWERAWAMMLARGASRSFLVPD